MQLKSKAKVLIAAAVASVCGSGPRLYGQLAAFPGAVGFAAATTGGRGDNVVVVSNLNSSGTGSFAQAVTTANATVVFTVGGYIDLAGEIAVAKNVTILGQTAPGGGIGLFDGELSFSEGALTNQNDIMEYVRIRQGNGSHVDTNKSAIEMDYDQNVIINHTSVQFGEFDNSDVNNCNGVTIQNSIYSDAIGQQFGIHAQNTSNLSLVDNLFATDHNRNPFIENNGTMQMINNVIYNVQAGFTSGSTGGTRQEDLVNNYFISGPSTTSNGDAGFFQVNGSDEMYASGNYQDTAKNGTLTGSLLTPSGVTTESSPWTSTTAQIPTMTAAQAVAYVEANAGASNVRDSLDSLDISQLKTYGQSGGQSGGDHLYGQPSDDGLANSGYGTLASGTVGTSSANDGIPDSWSLQNGVNQWASANSTTIANAAFAKVLDPIGYAEVEDYANSLTPFTPESWNAGSGNWATAGNWFASSLPGVFERAVIQGNGTANGIVTVNTTGNTAESVALGGNGPAAGEQLNITSGAGLNIQDTIFVGYQNNAALNISGGTVSAGNVQLGNTFYNSAGTLATNYTGTLSLTGGTLQAGEVVQGAGTPGAWNSGAAWTWSGGTLEAGSLGLLVSAPATLGSAGGILNTNRVSTTISGTLSGAGTLTVNGGGTATLAGTNTFTGVTRISGATLAVGTFTNGGVTGPLGQATNAQSNIILDGGTLMYVGSTATGTDRLFDITANGGTLNASGSSTLNFTSNAVLFPTAAANVTLTLTGTNGGHNYFNPALGDPTGHTTSVVMAGTGLWDLSGAGKTYSGNTTVQTGTLQTFGSNILSPYSTVVVDGGATLDFHGSSQTMNALSGAGSVTNNFAATGNTLTVGQNNGSGTFTGVLGNGTLNLIKSGTGTEIFTGSNAYIGTTTVNGGVLQFNQAASIGSTGVTVTVNSGATVAAGYAIDQTDFLDRITTASTGCAALAVNSANNLDFSTAGANLASVSLGAVGSATFTGTLTPNGTAYLLGGGGGTLTLPNASALTGSNSLQVVGPGVVVLTASNNYTGATTISSGELELAGAGQLPSGTGAGNVLVNTNGELYVADSSQINGLNNGTAGGGIVTGSSGTLTLGNGNATGSFSGSITGSIGLIKTGTGLQTLAGTTMTYTGATTISAGTLSITGSLNGSDTANLGTITVGNVSGSTGTLSINGLVNASAATAPSVVIGNTNGASGEVNVNGGTLNTTSELWVSSTNGSNGTLNISAGDVTVGSWLAVGRGGNGGNVLMSGGTLNVNSEPLTIASFAGNVGSVTVTGGTVNANTAVNAGESGTGQLAVSGTGVVNITGTGGLEVAKNAGAIGTVNLGSGSAGGMITTPFIAGSGTSTFNFNGGTLQANTGTTAFMQGVTTAQIRNGGAIIDTQANSITIAQPLLHSAIGGDNAIDGGLTKVGTGTLAVSGSSAYTGATAVNAGLLDVTGSIAGSSTISVTASNNVATLQLDGANALSSSAPISAGTSGTALPVINVNAGQVLGNISSVGTLNFNSGTVTAGTINDPSAGQTSTVNVGSAGFVAATYIRQGSLKISAGGTVRISSSANPGNPAGVSALNNLTNSGTLDLRNNALVVNNAAQRSSIITAVVNAADFNPTTGLNQWDKPGITSSSAAANASNYALGYLTGAELTNLGSTTFDGQPVTSNATAVAYTLIGDTELRGTVDGTDYNNVLANYDAAGDWSQGNFYNESIVSGDDYNAVLNAYDIAASGGATPAAKLAITRALSPAVPSGSPVATSGTFHLEVNTTSGDVTLWNDSTSSAPLTLYNIVDGSQQDLLIGNPADGNGTSGSIASGTPPYTNEHFLSVAQNDSNAIASITGRSSTNYKAWSLVLDGYNSNATALALSEGGVANKTDTINVPSYYSIDLGDIFNVGTTTVALTFQWGTETSAGGEGGTVYSNQPIDYIGTPEPASLGLLGLGGLAMMRRRRKA